MRVRRLRVAARNCRPTRRRLGEIASPLPLVMEPPQRYDERAPPIRTITRRKDIQQRIAYPSVHVPSHCTVRDSRAKGLDSAHFTCNGGTAGGLGRGRECERAGGGRLFQESLMLDVANGLIWLR